MAFCSSGRHSLASISSSVRKFRAGPGMPSPPGTSRLPQMARMRANVRLVVVEAVPSWSQVQPHWMQPGLLPAYMRAAARIWSGVSHVSGAAHSGV